MAQAHSFDDQRTRCPQLGHQVPFSYCRALAEGMPCRRIIDCWSGRVDIHGYLKRMCSPQEIARIMSPPKPKLLQIIELARAARDRSSQ